MHNDSLGGLQFGIDENGNYGYIKAGADTVTPFKSGISTIGDMHTMSSTSQTISADDCKIGDIYVCMAMSGSGKVNATNLVNCEIFENGSAVGWEDGSYQRSYVVIRCLDTSVSFTLNINSTGSANYSYYMRLS